MTKKNTIKNTAAANPILHIPSREELHQSYGGRVYPSDFNTGYPGKNNPSGSPIASRIASDFRWEQDLRLPKGAF